MKPRCLVADLPARWRAEDAREVLDALEASGMSLATFARREGIDPQRLYVWRRKLGVDAFPAAAGASSARLVELRVRQSSPVGPLGIEVACPSGHVVHVRDRAAVDVLAAVLRAVEGVSC